LGIPKELQFLRTCWLRYNFPSYRGRILIGSDVAYVFGDPPKARKGNRVLKGEFASRDHNMNIQVKQRGPHPTPRKIEHLLGLVDTFTNEGDIILDPFAGSGTTLIAAKQLKRNYVGIEISEKYCEAARMRLSQDMLF
jgi:DNA modification methylase